MKDKHALLYLAICTLCFVSCDHSQKLKQHIDQYANRMANILGTEPPQISAVTLPPYPGIQELQQDIFTPKLKLSEFYSLNHCRIYSLIAQRNTSLGQMQLPSTRYIYEKELIQALNQCLEDTTDKALKEKLSGWGKIKSNSLPLVWAELIQLSSEMKYAMSSNRELISGDEKDGINRAKLALVYLSSLGQKTEVSSVELETQLQNIQQSGLPAKLWLSQKLMASNLSKLTAWLKQHPLTCDNAKSRKKVEYLVNVFQLFFIEKIQPVAGKINDYQYQLSPVLKKLATHPKLSPSYKQRIHQLTETGFSQYQQAMSEHVTLWQSIFKRCNIQPGHR